MSPTALAICLALLVSAARAEVLQDSIYQPPALQDDYQPHADSAGAAGVEAARQQVAQLRERADETPRAFASALSRLGDAQLSNDDAAGAIESYQEALDVLEANVSLVDPARLEPLRGLGLALAHTEQHDLAVPHLERAVMIFHRAHGLLAPSQQGLLHQLASSLWHMQRYMDAEKQLLYMQRVGEHAYGRNDPRMAQVFNVIGTWHVDSGNFLQGRDHYRRAMQVVERGAGQRDVALVEPLRLLARSYTQELYLASQGLLPEPRDSLDRQWDEPAPMGPRRLDPLGARALNQALAILAAQPDADARTVSHTLVQTGDWFVINRQSDKALPYYQQAAQALALLPQTEHRLLSAPVRLYYPLPASAQRHRQLSPALVDERTVTVTFTVTAEGEVQDERVVENTGTLRHQNETLQAIRSARYRPRVVDGQPVATQNVVERQAFRLRRSTKDDAAPGEVVTEDVLDSDAAATDEPAS